MLIIRWGEQKSGRRIETEWHIGESLPDFKSAGYVIIFHADLDELNCLLAAMYASTGKHPTVDYTKMEGLHVKGKNVPQCPRCESRKLRCENGCTWAI